MLSKSVGAVAVAFAVLAGPAMAATVTIDLINDGWSNPTGGSNVLIANSANPGADLVYWGAADTNGGDPTGDNRSGYIWDSRNVSFNVDTDTVFLLGDFTHENFVIPGAEDAIDTVDLDFEVGTFDLATLSATFLFTHDETTNDPSPGSCSVGSIPCPDIVTISNAFFNTPITIGGVQYFFTLLGFSTDGGSTISNQFVTLEGQANTAGLYAIITAAPIPEPSAMLLLGLGLVGAARRLRRR